MKQVLKFPCLWRQKKFLLFQSIDKNKLQTTKRQNSGWNTSWKLFLLFLVVDVFDSIHFAHKRLFQRKKRTTQHQGILHLTRSVVRPVYDLFNTFLSLLFDRSCFQSQINLSLGHSHHRSVPPSVKPRLSMSFPGLRDLYDDPKAHRRSSVGFHGHIEGIRLKSVAQQQVLKEYRRRSDMIQQQQPTVAVVHVDSNGNTHTVPLDDDKTTSGIDEVDEEQGEQTMKPCPCLPAVSAEYPEFPEDGGCWAAFKYVLGWILFLISFPFLCAFTWTIPDCSKPHNRKYFLASFIMSIVWIAILSFGMVTLVGRSGCILSVDKFTMGLVVIAIGTSVPVSFWYIVTI